MEILIFFLIIFIIVGYIIINIILSNDDLKDEIKSFKYDIKYSLFSYVSDYEKEKVLDKLYKFAADIAKEENIPIFIKDDLGNAVGTYNYLKYNNYSEGLLKSKLFLENVLKLNEHCGEKYDIIDSTFPRIQLLKSTGENPWTLLHELGHHFQIKNGNFDHTENDADNYIYDVILNSNKFNILELYTVYNAISVYSKVKFEIKTEDVIHYLKCNNLYSTYYEKIQESKKLIDSN